MNLSLTDLPGEQWKPIPGIENLFSISNKGRVKRLNSWTQNRNKTFLRERIMSLFLDFNPDKTYYLYVDLSCNGKKIQIRIARFLYYCFVNEFDLKSRALAVINRNEPAWDLDISKLELQSSASHLRKKSYL